ncbi:MAG TPA: hypothetical protein VG225_04575 [Terracidiphilus sp.]|jgi:hypothetical protein|nr:hypothetical protein [Terracidiphilus sp.]
MTGEVIPGGPFVFAGALYSPGTAPMQPVNLSSKKAIRFWAKGDGATYTVLALTGGIGFLRVTPGKFQFEIDQVEIQ